MDIFTTQLTRVVPVPIKPTSLKVKALLKEAANSKLTQDPDHLENHEYYFTSEEDQYHANHQGAEQEQKKQHTKPDVDNQDQQTVDAGEADEVDKSDKSKHLDLYV
jgi:hypothetical protein